MIFIGTSLTARIKRTILVSFAVFALILVGHFAVKALSIVIALFYFPFSGGSGRGLDLIMNQGVVPLVTFIGGALAFGGISAIISAFFTSNKLWFKVITTIGIIGGILNLTVPPLQEWLVQQAAPIREFVEYMNKTDAEKWVPLALDFAKRNETIQGEAGKVVGVYLASTALKNDSINYYDICVQGTKTIYAIVEVSEKKGSPSFTLACTTTLNIGQRDPHKHPCIQ